MKMIDADKMLEAMPGMYDLADLNVMLDNGDFDPPKFSAEAVGKLTNIISFLNDYEKEQPVNRPDVCALCDHLLSYLEQLKAE